MQKNSAQSIETLHIRIPRGKFVSWVARRRNPALITHRHQARLPKILLTHVA